MAARQAQQAAIAAGGQGILRIYHPPSPGPQLENKCGRLGSSPQAQRLCQRHCQAAGVQAWRLQGRRGRWVGLCSVTTRSRGAPPPHCCSTHLPQPGHALHGGGRLGHRCAVRLVQPHALLALGEPCHRRAQQGAGRLQRVAGLQRGAQGRLGRMVSCGRERAYWCWPAQAGNQRRLQSRWCGCWQACTIDPQAHSPTTRRPLSPAQSARAPQLRSAGLFLPTPSPRSTLQIWRSPAPCLLKQRQLEAAPRLHQ